MHGTRLMDGNLRVLTRGMDFARTRKETNLLSGIPLSYLSAGLCVLPAVLEEKRPALKAWKQYQERLPTERQVETWFAEHTPLCVLTGTVSGHLEMIDFDVEGELFERWRDLVTTEAPGLIERL